MSSLRIVRGANQGADISLNPEKIMVLGRNPDCEIVIPISSVSREHARILPADGQFFIEDLKSRNGTYVNNEAIEGKTQLNHNDRIRICDFIATFVDPAKVKETYDPEEEEEESNSSTTVEATMQHNSSLLLHAQPAEKLRHLLDISASLSKTLDLDAIWGRIVENLFQLFRQADRCFIILAEEREVGKEPKLLPKFVQARREQEEASARFSRSIVRQCLETSKAFLSDDASQDNRVHLNQSVIDFRIRSVMCVPLCNAQGKAFGVIQLDTQDRTKKFTKDDLDLLLGVANQASISLENARLLQEARRQERLKSDLEMARRVQLSFLPEHLPEIPGYELFAHYDAAMQVGGDYYDFIKIAEDRLMIALGDVAGKGVAAALLSAKLSSDARYSFVSQADPKESILLLNNLLARHCGRLDKFITFAAAVLNPQTHEMTLVNGGHMSPMIYRAKDNTVEDCVPNKVAGLPLGVMEGYPFDSCEAKLEPGDSLLIFSDGVTEPMNADGKAFHEDGIRKALKVVNNGSPKRQIEYIVKELTHHTLGQPQHDDITLAGICRLP